MSRQQETTTKYRYSPSEIAALIAADIEKASGQKVKPEQIRWSVSDSIQGGYGTMGDPAHVYNESSPASFNGAEVSVTVRS
jgi:hypothetical protein